MADRPGLHLLVPQVKGIKKARKKRRMSSTPGSSKGRESGSMTTPKTKVLCKRNRSWKYGQDYTNLRCRSQGCWCKKRQQ